MTGAGGNKARWVKRGETVHIGSFGLFTGMFYIGRTFGPGYEGHDRYIIYPVLPIGGRAKDYYPGNPYFSSYEQLPPSGRKAYLEWLSGSCRDTDVPDHFVRLYCGGLYHRVFVEQGGDMETVFHEARRLVVLHRDNSVFVELLGNLLAFGSIFSAVSGQSPQRADEWRHSVHPAASVVLRIASLVGARQPIGADDAFLFAMERGKFKSATNLDKVDADGVRLLWRRRYGGRYPEGMLVDPPPQKLKLELAMPDGVKSVRVPVPAWAKTLPDPRLALGMCERIDTMLAECVREMGGYSRLVRKTPGAAGTLQAVAALPKQLVATSLAGRFSNLKSALDNQLAKQGIAVSAAKKLFEFMELPFRSDDEITPSVRRLISSAMDKMDIGFEPDGRYGSTQFSVDGSIVFFRGEDGTPVEWTGSYAVHRALADFVMGHVCGPDRMQAAETALFEIRRADLSLEAGERIRLGAHARSLARNHGLGKPPPFKQGKLADGEKRALAKHVVEAVALLPELEREALAKVEKFIAKLGGDRRELHSALHRRATADGDGLVSVLKAEPDRGVVIPKPPRQPTQSLPSLDLEKLKRLEAETVEVTGLLSGIFSEPQQVSISAPVETPAEGTRFGELDVAHSSVLAAVMEAGTMARAKFDALAKSVKLMPDGALETINDMALDAFGEAVLVDIGDVSFEEHLRGVLEQTRVSG